MSRERSERARPSGAKGSRGLPRPARREDVASICEPLRAQAGVRQAVARPSKARARDRRARIPTANGRRRHELSRGAIFYIITLALRALIVYYVNLWEITPPEASRSLRTARRGAARVEAPKRARARNEPTRKIVRVRALPSVRAAGRERARTSEGGPPRTEERAPAIVFGCAFVICAPVLLDGGTTNWDVLDTQSNTATAQKPTKPRTRTTPQNPAPRRWRREVTPEQATAHASARERDAHQNTKGPLSQSFWGFLCIGQKIYNLINIGVLVRISRGDLCIICRTFRK